MLGVRSVAPMTGVMATRIGEYRCEKLPDLSDICLNTNTYIRYFFNRNVRHIEVLSGEATFTVKIDAHRPLEVSSGQMLVHDISTAFNVRRKADCTQVTVIAGQVRAVAPMSAELKTKFQRGEIDDSWKTAPEIRAGQQLEFDEATQRMVRRADLSAAGLSQLLSWLKGAIDLTGSTIGLALEELSRYQPAMKLEYSDPDVALIPVDGYVRSDDLSGFLETLKHGFHIRYTITHHGDETVVTLSRRR